MHLLEDKKKHPLRFQALGEPRNIYVAGCFFNGQVNAVNAFVATQGILVRSTHMDASSCNRSTISNNNVR